jgi:hypothetical protein
MNTKTTLRNVGSWQKLLSKSDDKNVLEAMARSWERIAAQRERDLQPDE